MTTTPRPSTCRTQSGDSLYNRLEVLEQLRIFMKTMWKNFCPLIKAGPLRLEHDEVLFSQTQVALPIPWVEWPGPGNGGPPCVLESFQSSLLSIVVEILPNISAECCLFLFSSLPWRMHSTVFICPSEMTQHQCSSLRQSCLLIPLPQVLIKTISCHQQSVWDRLLEYFALQLASFQKSFS